MNKINDINLIDLKDDVYYVIDNQKDHKLMIDENKHLNILYFSRYEGDIQLEFDLAKYATLNIDFILMNNYANIDLNINLLGEYSECYIRNINLVKNGDKYFNVNVNHQAKYTNSMVSNNAICFDNGNLNFNIVGHIEKDMKDANARQLTRGLILGENASCKALPVLLIDYFDVKAYHGATIGKINDDDLFYLMSRGLSKKQAFALIINSLLEPFLKKITDEEMKSMIEKQYLSYFEGDENE